VKKTRTGGHNAEARLLLSEGALSRGGAKRKVSREGGEARAVSEGICKNLANREGMWPYRESQSPS